jgi:hypothetical protein
MINVLATPFSRGSVRLSSLDPLAPPLIDPGIFSNPLDRELLYACVRNTTLAIIEIATPLHEAEEYGIDEQWRGIVSDEGIRARVLNTVDTINHGSGTCAMGRVVDTECKVKGVQGLRVVDASVLPFPMASHYQAVVYALAEQVSGSFLFLGFTNDIVRWLMPLHFHLNGELILNLSHLTLVRPTLLEEQLIVLRNLPNLKILDPVACIIISVLKLILCKFVLF